MFENILLTPLVGHETTAHTLTWFVYALAKNLDVQTRVHASVDDWMYTKKPGALTFASNIPPLLDY